MVDPVKHALAFAFGELGLLFGLTALRSGDGEVVLSRVSNYLHVYQPRAASDTRCLDPPRVLVFVHGGGWHAGSIDPDVPWWETISYASIGQKLASRGHTVALIGYPLCETPRAARISFYIALAVFSWALAAFLSLFIFSFGIWICTAVPCYLFVVTLVHSRAMPFHQTPGTSVARQCMEVTSQLQRVGNMYGQSELVVVGHSAGAHLACYAVMRSPHLCVRSFVGLSGVYATLDLMSSCNDSVVQSFLPVDLKTNITLSPRQILPSLSVDQHVKTVWRLFTAQADAPVLIDQANSFHTALVNKGLTSTRLSEIGLGHGCGMVFSEQVWNFILTDMITP